MKILIFGGSFNPPTLAHEAIIAKCLKMPEFDQVWVMPSGSRSDKHITTSAKHRLTMLNIVKAERFLDSPRLLISDFELALPQPNTTYATVKKLKLSYPNDDFWFVFGGDAYRFMPSWPHGKELQKTLQIIVVSDTKAQHPTIQLPKNLSAISSTEVRGSAKALQSQVSPVVAQYVIANKLYSA